MKSAGRLAKSDFEALSEFRYQLRRFLRFSEQAAEEEGLTPLQYQLMLHIKGFPQRESATVGELAERLQAHHHGVVALVTSDANQLSITAWPRDRVVGNTHEFVVVETGVADSVSIFSLSSR